MSEAYSVFYPAAPDKDNNEFTEVITIEPDALTDEVAHGVLQLLTDAYAAEFEGRHTPNPLPKGAVAAFYRPDDEQAVREHRDRMEHYVEGGSTYWRVARFSFDDIDYKSGAVIPGLIKISPSRSSRLQKFHIGKLYLQTPNAYVNDLLVQPRLQGLGLGSLLMHAGLKFGGYDPARWLSLDGYVGSAVNPWFETGLGLQPVETPEPLSEEIAGQKIPQIRYSSEGMLTIRGIIARLEANRGSLKLGIPHNYTPGTPQN